MGTFDSADLLLGAQGRPAPPCVMVIFGAAGDLTKRKLIPALYNLARSRLLPDQFAIVGVSREEYSIDEFRTRMAPEAWEYTISELDRETWDWFAKRLYYMSGDFQDPKLFQKLEALLAEVEKEQDTQGNCIFYLATSPTFFPIVVKQLGLAGLTDEVNGKWRRVVIEKPFGVELRGDYYDRAGALCDMVPNHIFQLISLTAMEPPISFDAAAVHDEQTKILRAIQPMNPERVLDHAVRGQYGEGTVEGRHVPAYRTEPRVQPGSTTETFVALALNIDNWRWAGVPFYLRTGKRMKERLTEIVIRFRRPPFMLFRKTSVEKIPPNELVLSIQPNEGISLSFQSRIPGPVVRLGSVNMDFQYADYFGTTPSTGYETLLYDCMMGDPTLFQRADMVEASWTVVQPILDVWKALPPRDFPNYAAGSWGPDQATELLRREGREWRNPTRKQILRRDPTTRVAD